MKKKCQVPGCNCQAAHTDSGKGIYSGVYLEWNFRYCGKHSATEVEEAEEGFIRNLTMKMNKCVNSFECAYNELGKAAG